MGTLHVHAARWCAASLCFFTIYACHPQHAIATLPTAQLGASNEPSDAPLTLDPAPDDTQLDTVGAVCVDHHGALTIDR